MSEQHELVKIKAVMSVPMCGWNPHWGIACESLRPWGIPIELAFGAWWDHGICTLMEDCVEAGVDWILTLDYDTMFTAEDLDRLIGVFGRNPHIDALAPLMARRGTEETALVSVSSTEKVHQQITEEPIVANTAHFGLTLFRVEALKRMPKPWMEHIPDPDGSYRSSKRIDPDMYFWRKWKETGNTLYVDLIRPVGHLQPMVSVFADDYTVKHVHWSDWRAGNRRPKADRPQEVAA